MNDCSVGGLGLNGAMDQLMAAKNEIGRAMEVSNLLPKPPAAAAGLASSSPSTPAMAAFRSTGNEAWRTRNVSCPWFNPDIVAWSTSVRGSASEAATARVACTVEEEAASTAGSGKSSCREREEGAEREGRETEESTGQGGRPKLHE
jgi:hypothetical protein